MKSVIKILGIVLGLLSPVPYLLMLDNFDKFSALIKILGFIGYALILYAVFIYLFKRESWDRFINREDN